MKLSNCVLNVKKGCISKLYPTVIVSCCNKSKNVRIGDFGLEINLLIVVDIDLICIGGNVDLVPLHIVELVHAISIFSYGSPSHLLFVINVHKSDILTGLKAVSSVVFGIVNIYGEVINKTTAAPVTAVVDIDNDIKALCLKDTFCSLGKVCRHDIFLVTVVFRNEFGKSVTVLLYVFLSVMDFKLAALINVVSSEVRSLGIKKKLHRINEGLCIKSRAVVKLKVITKNDLVCLVLIFCSNAVLTNVFGSYVNGIILRHRGNDFVTGIVIVIIECIKCITRIIENVCGSVRLVGVNIPGIGEVCGTHTVGIGLTVVYVTNRSIATGTGLILLTVVKICTALVALKVIVGVNVIFAFLFTRCKH